MTGRHHPGFWIGVFLFVSGLILFIIGFSAPYWVSYSSQGIDYNSGLWLTCISKSCASYSRDSNAEYMKATEALQCLALGGIALVCVLLLADICSASFRRKYRRSIETVGFISAVLGLLGVAVFGGWYLSGESLLLKLDWAIALDIAGLLLILISAGVFALVFALCNKKRLPRDLAKDNPAYLPPEYDQRRMTDYDMRRTPHEYDNRRPAPDYEPRRLAPVDYRRDYPHDRVYVRDIDRRSASMDDLAAIPYYRGAPKAPYLVPYSRSYVYY